MEAWETTISWKQMFRFMQPSDLENITGRGDGSGVSRIWIEPIVPSYDSKRWVAAVALRKPFPSDAPVTNCDFRGADWRNGHALPPEPDR